MYVFRSGLSKTDIPETGYTSPKYSFFATPHPIYPTKNEITTGFGTHLNFSMIQEC
jgi:hypothetical protein